MFKAVIDTNVIISALLKEKGIPGLILSLVLQKKIELCLSKKVFDEYQGVLARKKFRGLDPKKVKRLLSQIKKQGLWVVPKVSVNAIKKDPDDNKFLECCLEADADFLITGNIKHFLFRKFHRTHIVTPREFIDLFLKFLAK